MGPLRHREFRLFWFGLIMQATGGWINQVATGWLILDLSDSPLLLGLNSFFQAVPFLIASLWGGAVADRFDRRRILQITQFTGTLLALAPALLSALGIIEVWHIYVLGALSSAVGGIDSPARLALLPALVPRSDLTRAIALTSVIRRGTALVGPMIGGGAIVVAGVQGGFFLQAVCLFIMLVATAFMRTRSQGNIHGERSFTRSIVDGFRYAQTNPLIFGTLIIEAVSQSLIVYTGILPVFARNVLKVGPDGLGLLYSAPGIGALVASFLMVAVGDPAAKGRIFLFTAMAKPAVVIFFALSVSMPTSLLALALYGFLDVTGGTVRTTMLQVVAREGMLGRVMSMDNMVHRGLGTLSGLQLGAVASVIGAPTAVTLGAAVALAFAGYQFLRHPVIYRYRDGDETNDADPPPFPGESVDRVPVGGVTSTPRG